MSTSSISHISPISTISHISPVSPLPKGEWKDREEYWEHNAKQGSVFWKKIRHFKCSGTTTNGKSSFGESKEDIANRIAGKKEKIFSKEQKTNMKYGNDNEPIERDIYEIKYHKKVKEMGFCVPKFNFNIGASVDGKIIDENGIIEIKCPQKMPWKIKKYTKSNPKPQNYNHIYDNHYRQMQFNMGCLGADFCDYIVSSRDGYRFVQRIPFDKIYWDKLYKETVEFWEDFVKPLIPI